MKVIEANALWGFEEDIQNRSWWDWLKAHTSGMEPLHRYSGKIILAPPNLSFQGVDTKTDQPVEFEIKRSEMVQMYLGFDETYSALETRALGLFWEPLRLKFVRENREVILYLIINYHLASSDNKQWFDLLKDWLS